MRFFLSIVILCCITSYADAAKKDADAIVIINDVKKQLKSLDLTGKPQQSQELQKYFSYYGLDVEGAEQFLGTVKAGGYDIAAHVLKVPEARGTVLLVHGYYDHMGIWKHLVSRLIKEKFNVVMYDQPGHGLSSGPRCSIKKFSEYTVVFKEMLGLFKAGFPGRQHVVAHSMGCAPVLDCILSDEGLKVDEVVLLAPLVRSVAWGLSGFGARVAGSSIKTVPRKYRKNSSDKDFLKFIKSDPLHCDEVPMQWVNAHRAWVASIESLEKKSDKKIMLIQGTSDKTVKWKHNIPFVQRKFSSIDYCAIKGAGHQLLNESKGLRQRSIDKVIEHLSIDVDKITY